MVDAQPTLEQLSLPGKPLSTADCLAAAGSLKGRVVVITGAGSGFGAAFSRLAASHGAKVVASDLNTKAVEAVVQDVKDKGGEAISCHCDTTDWASQVAMFKAGTAAFGPIDVVVANAGVSEAPGWFDESLDEAGDPKKPNQLTTDVNLLGASYTARLGFHYLGKNSRPEAKSLLLVGSIASFVPIPIAPMYTMGKHAIHGLARSLYYIGGNLNIHVSLIAPWFVDTGLFPSDFPLIAGFPLAKLDDVALSMLKAATTEDGEILFIDAHGVMSVKYDAMLAGEGNLHDALVRRGNPSPADGPGASYYHTVLRRASGRA